MAYREVLVEKESILLPVNLFNSSLSPLESIVRFLKNGKEMRFSEISRLLNRSETTIWTTYNNSLKKSPIIKLKNTDINVPLEIFSDRKYSVLESISVYLRDKYELNFREIGDLLGKNERTIWTVVNRAKLKSYEQ